MAETKRYFFDECVDEHLHDSEQGFVLYTDHQASLQELRKALEAADYAFGRINLGDLHPEVSFSVYEAQKQCRAALEATK